MPLERTADSKLIFIVGCGRSGTVWFGEILSSHPDVHCTVERPDIFRLATDLALDAGKRELLFPRLVSLYREECARSAPRHYADKSHPNLWLAERLAAAFPSALFLGIQRDAFATVASMLKHSGVLQWHRRWREFPVPNAFLGITSDGAEAYERMSLPAKCALRWRAHRDEMLRLEHTLHNRFLTVQYEDLNSDPRAELERVAEFLGIESSFAIPFVRQKSLDRWRDELTGSSYDEVAAIAQEAPVDRPAGEPAKPSAGRNAKRWAIGPGPAKLSICVALKNRSRVMLDDGELLLFPNCVRSIVDATSGGPEIELVVADWQSDDWPLREWLNEAAGTMHTAVVAVKGPFNRRQGRNIAARHASGDVLLFLDPEVLVCRELIERGMELCRQGKAFFPVLWSLQDGEHVTDWWGHAGIGNCMLSRGAFEACGGCPEYTPWGREDEDFHSRVAEVVETVREPVPGFQHQGHPNPLMWKDRDADPESAQRWELAQASQMIDEMSQHIPAGAKYICVDDAYFRSNPVPGRHGIPFLERNGEYWGAPADGETAVRELVRLRNEGVKYLAFLYPSFWWLQHYSELKSFIGHHYRWVLRNDRVWICDLSRGRATQPPPQAVPEFSLGQTRRVATDSA